MAAIRKIRSQRAQVSTKSIGIDSEIGRLRRVFLHTPGREVELMTPKTASELLYNDILHYEHLREGHLQLKGVLSLVAEVLEVEQCLAEMLESSTARVALLNDMVRGARCPELLSELLEMPGDELARRLIGGIPLRRDTLERHLSPKSFSINPLPNLYFMRDPLVVVGSRFIASRMAGPVRAPEALLMRALFQYHPGLKCDGLLFDASAEPDDGLTIEGGDVLVVSKDLLMVGISERTTPRAVDRLIERLREARRLDESRDPFAVVCVMLPRERSTIHLDMVFTFVDRGLAVVYAPYVLGRQRCPAVSIQVSPGGDKKFRDFDDPLQALKSLGLKVEPILCGGKDPLHQSREQWNSGSNMFAFGPGKILSYGMHEHTARACEEQGFRIIDAKDAIKTPKLLERAGRLLVTVDGAELARGGGGPRCMTCPILRDPFDEA